MDELLTDREETFRVIRKKLLKAQASMKAYVDTKRREVTYALDDWVLLRLRPYRQLSARDSQATTGKLAKRFYGPFKVLEKIGGAAYRLQLPEGTKIHPVFHYSLLKPFRGAPDDAKIAKLPATFIDNQPLITPSSILDYRKSPSNPENWEVLVQWDGLHLDDTSWEDWDQLRQRYHLEGKVILQGPRGDREVEHATQAGADIHEEVQTATEQQDTGVLAENKPKRRIAKPTYLRDYI